ncbi:BTR1-like protein [Hordeum vulgare]|nr:BTR1-like protein [Hordeum vulgare]
MPGWLFQPSSRKKRGGERKKERKKEREREMAQPAGWKAMYQQVVIEADGSCADVEHRVAAARTALESPEAVLTSRDPTGVYTLLKSALDNVEQASDSLSAFIIHAVAAERLALHGCGPIPSQPVARIADLRDDHHDRHDERLALNRLEDARDFAKRALRGVDGALKLLGSVQYMLRDLGAGAAGRRQAMKEQLQAAARELQLVAVSVCNTRSLARMATEPPIGQ